MIANGIDVRYQLLCPSLMHQVINTFERRYKDSELDVMDLVLSMTMMLVCSLLTVFSVFASLVLGCTEGNGHDHEHSNLKRSVPSLPLTPPSRPLEWGDINILHTTDTHGWLLGHQKSSFPEPNYRFVARYNIVLLNANSIPSIVVTWETFLPS